MLVRVCLFLLLQYVGCEVAKRSNDIPEKGSMLGVDTVHNMMIGKDTILNRSLRFERKGRRRNTKPASAHHQTKKSENHARKPDWSYRDIPQEVSGHVEAFKRNLSECLKEVQHEQRPVRLSARQSPVHGECLIACVLKRNGVIQQGRVHKENLLLLVSKFYSKEAKLMKKLGKNVDRCIELSGSGRHDECALAARLNACTNDLMASNKHKLVVNY